MPSIYRFARILIAKPVPTFAEYAQEKPVLSAFGGRPPSLKRRIPADIIAGGSFRPPITRICLKATPIRCLANIFA